MIPDIATRDELASKTRLRLWLRLLKTTGRIEAELRRLLRERHDTTLPRFDVMAALARHPDGLRMSELSSYLRVSNGNVTGIVDRLTEDGLALRVAVDGDRRAQRARLTAAGRARFDELAREHEEWIDHLLGQLEEGDTRTLTELLARVERGERGR